MNRLKFLPLFLFSGLLSVAALAADGGTTEPGNLGTSLDGLIGVRPQTNVTIIDERELLRRYLDEVERRSEAESNTVIARLDMQRDIFNAYNQRWWAQYQDQQLQDRSRRYWSSFRAGSDYADSVLRNQGAGNNSCLLLRELVDNTAEPNLPNGPAGDAELSEAYRRGVVSEAPECFISNLTDKVKGFFSELSNVDTRLFEINVAVQGFKPDERAIENVYKTLEKALKDSADGYVDEMLPKITKALSLSPERMANLKIVADRLAASINCSQLKGPSGQSLSCITRVVNSRKPLDRNAAYKILFGHLALGDYQQGLDFQDLFLAAATYRQLNPEDRMVEVQVGGIRSELNELDRIMGESVENMRKSSQIALRDRLRDMRLDNIDVWRSLFDRNVATEIVRLFFSLRERILMYQRIDMASRLEENILAQVKDVYNHALNTALTTSLTVNLPQRNLTIELDDLEGTLIELPFDVSNPPSGYLLGRDQEQVSFWANYLRL